MQNFKNFNWILWEIYSVWLRVLNGAVHQAKIETLEGEIESQSSVSEEMGQREVFTVHSPVYPALPLTPTRKGGQ